MNARLTVVPAIDLRGGNVVRLLEGHPEHETRYATDPASVARDFEARGAVRLHVVDLDGAIDNHPQPQVIEAIVRAVRIPIEVGGGIRTVDQAERLVASGVERVIFGTVSLKQPEVVQESVRRLGARVAVALDARDGKVAVRGWQEVSAVDALELARQFAAWGVARIQYTDVSRDGTLSGPNLEGTAEVARVSGLRVTAAGGVSSLADLHRLTRLVKDGVDEAIVGKALYERRFTLEEALAVVADPTAADRSTDNAR
jgi:phosphoribosylformimino-5-aminoimidazole carboxamide ribotide isomerase